MSTLTFNERYDAILEHNGTRLCIGLDTDINNLPEAVRSADNPVLEFNRRIIESTADLCCSYKMNLAFYESGGHFFPVTRPDEVVRDLSAFADGLA